MKAIFIVNCLTQCYNIMNDHIALINQFFEIEQKLLAEQLIDKFDRNLRRIQNIFEASGLLVINPIGEAYSESRTDYEASIVGNPGQHMKITKVIKPVIYQNDAQGRQLLQKGIVIAEQV